MTVRDNWYENFFQGLNCELWEKAASPEWTVQEVDFLVQEFGLQLGRIFLTFLAVSGGTPLLWQSGDSA